VGFENLLVNKSEPDRSAAQQQRAWQQVQIQVAIHAGNLAVIVPPVNVKNAGPPV
jgi:hypothetical protein